MEIDQATVMRLRDALLSSGRETPDIISTAYEVLTREGMLTEMEKKALCRVDAMIETLYLVMTADRDIRPEEQEAIQGAVRVLTDNTLHPKTVEVMIDSYQQKLAAEGREARLKAIGSALSARPRDAENAFALAAAVALADNRYAPEENTLIEQLRQWFGISDEYAERITSELPGVEIEAPKPTD